MPKYIEISICADQPGFSVEVELPGHDTLSFHAPGWADARRTANQLESLIKTVVRDQSLIVAPLPHCEDCKSEDVWHRTVDGTWTRICMECDHVEHF